MNIPAPLIILLLAVSPLNTAQASSLSDQGLRLLLGEPAAMDSDLLAPSGKPGSLNLHFSQPIGTYTNFFGSLSQINQSSPVSGMAEAGVTAFQSGLEWFFSQQKQMQWFLLGGMGGVQVNDGNKTETTSPIVSLGLGQSWAINTQDALRWELRANQTLGSDSNLPNWTPVNFQAIFSYQWGN